RRGFQKHLLRFRLATQMETLDEWNVELVLVNSHDAGCAYQLHAGIYRRICANGLVLSEGGFSAIRFRHAGLEPEEVVNASLRLIATLRSSLHSFEDYGVHTILNICFHTLSAGE